MTGVELDLSAESLARAPVDRRPGRPTTSPSCPTSCPAIVRDLALEVTRDAADPLREGAGAAGVVPRGRRLHVRPETPRPGNGTDDLVRFLTEGDGGRIGYCEQFASAMAVMARSLGIPARVAVGFLEPEQVGDETCEYSAHDLHAWPELYFAGAGWVRFEPTPPGRASGVPAYTTERVAQLDDPSGAERPRRERPAAEPRRPARARSRRRDSASDGGSDEDESGFPWLPVAGGTAGGTAGGRWLLLLPRTLRRRRTHGPGRRRARGGLGGAARHRDRPRVPVARRTARRARPATGWSTTSARRSTDDTPERPRHGADVAPEAVTALDRIVLALERLRYAARPTRRPTHGALRDELEHGASPRCTAAPRVAPVAGRPGGRGRC